MDILDVAFSNDELNIKERLYIKTFNAFGGGYNKTRGGEGVEGYKHSEETRASISRNNSMKRPEIREKFGRKVININTKKIFKTIAEAKNWSGLNTDSGIIEVCKGKRKTAGTHPVTGERLRWAYYDEYLKQQEQQGV